MSGSDLRRDDSFRTAIKNQKRRLSATKMPSPPNLQERRKSSVVQVDLKAVFQEIGERRKSRSGSLPDIKDLKFREHPEEAHEATQSEKCSPSRNSPSRDPLEKNVNVTPASAVPPSVSAPPPSATGLQRPQSPYAPKRPSPLVIQQQQQQNKATSLATPDSPSLARAKSPIRPDSPLLSSNPPSPVVKRARELRRAGSFRRSLERSRERSKTRAEKEREQLEREPVEELSFCIRRHNGGRQGWKIMPETMGTPLKPEAVRTVVGMIKEMELSGHQVPDRITIKV